MKKPISARFHFRGTLFSAVAMLSGAFAALSSQAATHTFSGTTSANTTWSSGTSWNSKPVSSLTSNLTFSGTYASGTVVATDNDIAGNFTLNALYVNTAGPVSGNSSLIITGNPLEFVINGGTNATITLSSTGTTRPSFTLNNGLILTNNTRIAQGSASVAATLGGVISGSGNLNKGGTGSVTLSNNASTYSGATVIESGTFLINKLGTIGNPSSLGSGGNITLGSASGSGVLQWVGSSETSDKAITLGGSTGNGTLTASPSGQTLTISGNVLGGSSTSNRSLFVNGVGSVILNGTVSNGSVASGGVITVTKSAAGSLTLAGNNTYSGGTNLNAGTVVLAHAAGFGTGAVTLNGGTLSNNGNLTFNNNIVLTTGNVSTATSTTLTSAGAVSGAAALAKSGAGTLLLTNSNSSFTGGVWVQAGSIYSTGLGNASADSTLGTNGTIKLGNNATAGTLRYIGAGNETSDKVIDLAGTTGGGTITANQSVLTLTSNLAMSGAGDKTLTLASSGGTAGINFNGLLANVNGVLSLRVNGSGIGFFALGNNTNSFTGSVTVDGNIVNKSTRLSVSAIGNSGANSALGQSGTINLGSSVAGSQNILVYTGSGETTDKVINLGGSIGNAGLEQFGTGLLKFTSGITVTGSGNKTLYADQYDALGTTEFAGSIPDSAAGATLLNKNGNGTLVLSASNTFTGGTIVKGGTLQLSSASALSSGNVSFTSDGVGSGVIKLAYAGNGPALGNLLVQGNATIDLGTTADASITFATASGWTAGTVLTVSNSATGKLYIVDGTGLDLTQVVSLETPLVAATRDSVTGLISFAQGDTQAPVITLNGSATVSVSAGSSYTDAGATATDNVDASVTVTTSGTVDTATPGVYTVTYNAIDAAGNAATPVTRAVTVSDTTAPVITLTGSATASVAWGSSYTDAGATATDDVDSSVTVNSGGSVNANKPGTYTLTYDATDAAGNVATQVTRAVAVSISNPTTVGADGYSPVMKYAFGANSPSDTVQAPVTSSTATTLSVTAVVRTNDANVVVTGEAVTDLASTWGTGGTVTVTSASDQSNLPANCARKVFTVDTTGAAKKFLRLKVVGTF